MSLLILSLLVGSSLMGTELEEIRKAIRVKGAKWEAGETSVSRLSLEERRRLLGDNLADDFLKAPGEEIRGTKDLPTEFDWRNKDGHFWMTPIKDQENCGACVAFGACGALEANIKIYANNPWIMPNLSEQELFSCGRGPGGCEYGWNLTSAMSYFVNNGTPDETCLPYTAVDDNCDDTCSDRTARARKISNWGWTNRTIASIKQAIYDYGPLEGHFYVYADFFSYHGGVYEHVWGDYEGGHAITVLGWSDSSLCWICKNSWGRGWGEYGPYPDSTRGWFRIKYGECEIEDRKATWMIPIIKGPDGMVLHDTCFGFVLLPDSSASDTLTISNVGDSLDFYLTLSHSQNWLILDEISDTLSPAESVKVDFGITTTGLFGGTYCDTIEVAASDSGDTMLYRVNVPVCLVVSPLFVRGDYDDTGDLAMPDALRLLLWKYHQPGGVAPTCKDAADYDDDGNIAMPDALSLLLYKYHQPGGVPPAPPYPDCGLDFTEDELECVAYSHCLKAVKSMVLTPASVKSAVNRVEVKNYYQTDDGLMVVPVELTNEAELRGFECTVNYDPALVTAVKVDGGNDYDFFAPWIDNESGKVTVGIVPDMSMQQPLAPGQRVVAEIAFRVKADVSLKLSDVALYGLKAEVVDARWVDGVVKAGAGLPKEFALSQNYPNPFNPTTLIKYDLPVDCQVRLDVYNVLGQRVATLVDGQQKAGYKVATWNAQDMASGIYFYRLKAGDFISIRKMVFLK